MKEFKQVDPFNQAQPPENSRNGNPAGVMKTQASFLQNQKESSDRTSFEYKPLKQVKWATLRIWRDNPIGFVYHAFLILAILMTLGTPIFLWRDSLRLATYKSVPESPAAETAHQQPSKRASNRNYLSVVANRQFFKQVTQPKLVDNPEPISASELPGLNERYMLLGILMGENPQAIIQDKMAGSSLFLSPGQRLGDFKITEILPDRVILTQDGQNFELRI